MKKILLVLLCTFCFQFNSKAQCFLYNDKFESFTDSTVISGFFPPFDTVNFANPGGWISLSNTLNLLFGGYSMLDDNTNAQEGAKSLQILTADGSVTDVFAFTNCPSLPIQYVGWYNVLKASPSDTFEVWALSGGTDIQDTSGTTGFGKFVHTSGTTSGWQQFTVNINYTPSATPTDTITVAFLNTSHNTGDSTKVLVDNTTLVLGPTSNTAYVQSDIVIWPNPADNSINIAGDYDKASLSDLNGRKIMTTSNEGIIDISDTSPGLYILRLDTPSGIITRKISIK